MNTSKRRFLGRAAGLSLAAGAVASSRAVSPFAASLAAIAGLGAQASSAATAGSDYRALVCLFMAGGNDSHNWVVPVDAGGYSEYAAARSSLALPLSGLTALSAAPSQASGRRFAFANDLSALRDLYEQGSLAVVSNVGPLVRPTTKAQFEAGSSELPPKLFSHNDQQSNWQAMAPEGARAGWGGRIADVLMSTNDAPVFTTVSACGNAIFLSGLDATQYQISTGGAVGIGGLKDTYTLSSRTVASVMTQTQFASQGNAFQREYARVAKRSADAYATLSSALAGVQVRALQNSPLSDSAGGTTTLEQLPLARQLRAVAQMIAANRQLGMRRQVFMVSMGGFDTHANQLRDHPRLMLGVSQSISFFMQAINDLGLGQQVTLFTASDFGRTLTSNGSGSDHGWGSHHVVAGGAVKGRDIYGQFPSTALGTQQDVGSGRLLPSTSVAQYGATLARWIGVSNTDLATVFPTLSNFDSAGLGFV